MRSEDNPLHQRIENDPDGIGQDLCGQYTSIKYDANGVPRIAYYVGRIGADQLRYAYRVPSGGNCGTASAIGK